MNHVSGRRGRQSSAPAAPTRHAGRPEGGTGQTRAGILDAAERIFADQGYAGTTLKEISQAAGVTQALITYYFRTKFALFGETFLRRASVIAAERITHLARLHAEGRAGDVVAVVTAFLQPVLAMRGTEQGRAFLRLHARLHTEPPNLSYELRKTAYDESTRRYIEALHHALPHLSRVDVHWRVTFMIGTYLYALSDTNRMDDMVPDQYDPADSAKLMAEAVSFIVGGLLRPSTTPAPVRPRARARACPR